MSTVLFEGYCVLLFKYLMNILKAHFLFFFVTVCVKYLYNIDNVTGYLPSLCEGVHSPSPPPRHCLTGGQMGGGGRGATVGPAFPEVQHAGSCLN